MTSILRSTLILGLSAVSGVALATPAGAFGVQRMVGARVTSSASKTTEVSCQSGWQAITGGGTVSGPGAAGIKVTTLIKADQSGVIVHAAETVSTPLPWSLQPWVLCESPG